jgi:hypothetical protein
MYDKIANDMNLYYGSSDITSEDVENYLRYGDVVYISDYEARIIDQLLDKYL